MSAGPGSPLDPDDHFISISAALARRVEIAIALTHLERWPAARATPSR